MSDSILLLFEMIGVVASSASGALTGMKKHMDFLGVTFLGIITAMGGGIMRDIILGAIPPVAFIKPVYVATAFVVAACMFFIHRYFPRLDWEWLRGPVLIYMDAVGLGAFTVVGIKKAVATVGFEHIFLIVCTGFLTGVGGGMIRDVLSGETPFIFKKYFYACASVIGAVACVLLWKLVGEWVAMFAGIVIIVVLRLCAARYHWSLFKDKDYEE